LLPVQSPLSFHVTMFQFFVPLFLFLLCIFASRTRASMIERENFTNGKGVFFNMRAALKLQTNGVKIVWQKWRTCVAR
jgi:hypothetical protein